MAPSTAANSAFMSKDQFLAHWQGHRALSRRVIEAFPEDQLFSFSVGGMRPFGELAGEMLRMAAPTAEGAATGKWVEYAQPVPSTKQGLLERWDEDTKRIDAAWAKVTEDRLQERDVAFGVYDDFVYRNVLYVIDNEIHHRAQGYVYLRALGVEPPPFWER